MSAHPGRLSERGFTLVEVGIALVVVVLAVSVVLPAFGALTLTDLRKTTRILAGNLRATFDRAVLTGENHRAVFDLKENKVRFESSGTRMPFGGSGNAFAEVSKSLFSESEGEAPEFDVLSAFMTLGAKGAGAKTFTEVREPLTLDDDVTILDVWTESIGKPIREGTAAIHFFRHGYSEHAIVNLQAGDYIFALELEPLTGKVSVESGYLEAPK